MEKEEIIKAIVIAYSNVLLDSLPLNIEYVNKFKEEKLVKEKKNGKIQ